jgi:hypothetical protein
MLSDQKVPKTHNICKLYDKIKTAGIKLEINEEYLALLFKSYLLRYPFDLPNGFDIGLYRTKLLVELDHTVYEIRKGFSFGIGDKKITTRFDGLLEKKDPVLLNKNCYFGNNDRAALFEEESSCYELRYLGQDKLVAFYQTKKIDDDGKYNVKALRPSSVA